MPACFDSLSQRRRLSLFGKEASNHNWIGSGTRQNRIHVKRKKSFRIMGGVIFYFLLLQSAFILTSQIVQSLVSGNAEGNRTTIRVSFSNGRDSEQCWRLASKPCKSLPFAMRKPDLNSTTILLLEGDHILNESVSVEWFQDLVLVSDAINPPKIICSGKNGGSFSFRNGRNLRMQSLLIENCGTNHTSTSKIKGSSLILYTSLFVEDSINVQLDKVRYDGSIGMGAVFYDVGGNVSFTNVTFANNRQKFVYKKRGLSSGGGIYIEFTQRNGNVSTVHNSHVNYTFQNCIFENNVAEKNYSYPSLEDDPNNYVAFGRGGGISFMSLGDASKNRLSIKNCTFINNTALWGSGVFAEFHGRSGNNTITVLDSQFTGNKASYGGGAIRAGLASNNHFGYNLIHIKRCTFRQNFGQIGGAFSQYRESKVGMEREVLTFEDCSFMGNRAYLGAAMHLSVSQFELSRVLLSLNYVINYKTQISGKGALYMFSSRGVLKNGNRIESNIWTGIVLEFSSLDIYDHVIFSNNTGINGGAIAAYAESCVVLYEKSRVDFISNTAIRLGGALYVKTPGPPMAPMDSTEFMVYKCFILFGDREGHPDDFDTKVQFINNSAPASYGSSVFISTLNWCREYGEPKYNNTAFQWRNFVYTKEDNESAIITNPIIMELHKEDWSPAPSMLFEPRVILRDELWNSTYGTVKLKISSTNGNVHLPGSDVFAVKDRLPKISITGKEGSAFNVTIQTVVGVTVRADVINTRLDNCPLGYFQSSNDMVCKCLSGKGMEKGVTHCQGLDVYILRGRWANPYGKHENFAKHHCPRNYCRKCNEYGREGIECIFKRKLQCGRNRKWDSVLCGSCKKGYSVKLGNEDCEKCGNATIVLLLVWMLALTVFVFVILALNAKNYFTYLNAYLYSYQVLPLVLVGNHYLDKFITFVMGLTNFSGTGGSFGVCLWDGMTDMQKLVLNYITPMYILLFTALFVYWSSHWKRCPFNKVSTLRSLALLSIFSYADFTRISFELLHSVKVNGQWVLYLQGDVAFFRGIHVVFGIFAIIVSLLIVVLFPCCLIFFHVLTQRWSKLQGIFNAFQEPFKEGYERFAVFYLICRLCLFAIFVFLDSGLVRDTVLAITCELILIVFLFIKPYKEKKMNYFDMLMLSNITIVSTINVGLNAVTEKENRRGLQVAAVVLTYFPLFCILMQLSYWALNELKGYLARRKDEEANGKYCTCIYVYVYMYIYIFILGRLI